jgi:hypothetical protein
MVVARRTGVPVVRPGAPFVLGARHRECATIAIGTTTSCCCLLPASRTCSTRAVHVRAVDGHGRTDALEECLVGLLERTDGLESLRDYSHSSSEEDCHTCRAGTCNDEQTLVELARLRLGPLQSHARCPRLPGRMASASSSLVRHATRPLRGAAPLCYRPRRLANSCCVGLLSGRRGGRSHGPGDPAGHCWRRSWRHQQLSR